VLIQLKRYLKEWLEEYCLKKHFEEKNGGEKKLSISDNQYKFASYV
jgi:hypothetical protein